MFSAVTPFAFQSYKPHSSFNSMVISKVKTVC